MHETLVWAVVLVVGAANLGLIALSACVDPRTGQWRRHGVREAWRAMNAKIHAMVTAARHMPRIRWAARGVFEAVFIVYTLSWLTLLA